MTVILDMSDSDDQSVPEVPGGAQAPAAPNDTDLEDILQSE